MTKNFVANRVVRHRLPIDYRKQSMAEITDYPSVTHA